ncbi:MAG: hypothetical protein WCS70_06825 [Verrucomicrobiota bacterium]
MMLFLWLVGWLFTVGVRSECEDADNCNGPILLLVSTLLFVVWPIYLGYVFAQRGRR